MNLRNAFLGIASTVLLSCSSVYTNQNQNVFSRQSFCRISFDADMSHCSLEKAVALSDCPLGPTSEACRSISQGKYEECARDAAERYRKCLRW